MNVESGKDRRSRLLVVVERYPELKATEAFCDLQAQLDGSTAGLAALCDWE